MRDSSPFYVKSCTIREPVNRVSKTQFVSEKAKRCTILALEFTKSSPFPINNLLVHSVHPPYRRVHRSRVWAKEWSNPCWALNGIL